MIKGKKVRGKTMKKTFMFLILAVGIGCTGTLNEVPYTWERGVPEFEWVEPLIFEHNLQICRSADVCRAESLFEK